MQRADPAKNSLRVIGLLAGEEEPVEDRRRGWYMGMPRKEETSAVAASRETCFSAALRYFVAKLILQLPRLESQSSGKC